MNLAGRGGVQEDVPTLKTRRLVSAAILAAAVLATADADAAQGRFLNFNPAWSPDGRWLVFESTRDGDDEDLWVVGLDGRGLRRLTDTRWDATHPTWSPDGSRIAFDGFADSVWNLYAIGADGTGLVRLTDGPAGTGRAFARHPAWSPDGRRIAFDSDRAGGRDVWTIAADGSDWRRVTGDPAEETHPTWSPDGDRLAFSVDRPGGGVDVAVIGVDGSGRIRVTDRPGLDAGAEWAPDGERLLFFSDRTGDPELFLVPVAGGEPAQLTDEPGTAVYETAWSPAGDRIAAYLDRSGAFEIYVLAADGSSPTRITYTPDPHAPAPAGRRWEAPVFVSDTLPTLALRLEGFSYAGRDSFRLRDVATVERHHFVDLDAEGVVERMVVVHLEGFLESAEGAYRFGVPPPEGRAGGDFRFSEAPVRLGQRSFVHNTWAFDLAASAAESPGGEAARTRAFLRERGHRLTDALVMSRFVRAVGEAARHEIILFYLEPLAAQGLGLEDLDPGGPPSERYDRVHRAVTERSLAALEVLADGPLAD